MDLLQSVILGSIQGTTEWLPISSTGNLRVAERFFGLSVPLLFDVLLHAATLLVTLIYFRSAIKAVLLALWHGNFLSEHGKLILPIIVGSIITGVIGVLIGNWLDEYFGSLQWLGVWFIISGALLLSTKFAKEKTDKITLPAAVFIGIMQGLAVIPSASRSGFTIAAMLLLGVKRELAFKFSFLLSIPAVAGALGLTLYQEHGVLATFGIGITEVAAALIVGVAVSFAALKLLEKTLAAKKFWLFSIYCYVIGAVVLALGVMGY